MKKGLLIWVYSNPNTRGCAMGGPSEMHDECIVVGDGIPEIFEAAGRPVLVLKENRVSGCAHLEPEEKQSERHHLMFGGSFAHTSDSRFSRAVERITGGKHYGAVPIHDRMETERGNE
jgi:hypothetical protein